MASAQPPPSFSSRPEGGSRRDGPFGAARATPTTRVKDSFKAHAYGRRHERSSTESPPAAAPAAAFATLALAAVCWLAPQADAHVYFASYTGNSISRADLDG